MNIETIQAIYKDRDHWCDLRDRKTDHCGSLYCLLCQLFQWHPNKCLGCPIKQATGEANCRNTPYYDALEAIEDGAPDRYDKCQAMVDFLESLLPEEYRTPPLMDYEPIRNPETFLYVMGRDLADEHKAVLKDPRWLCAIYSRIAKEWLIGEEMTGCETSSLYRIPRAALAQNMCLGPANREQWWYTVISQTPQWYQDEIKAALQEDPSTVEFSGATGEWFSKHDTYVLGNYCYRLTPKPKEQWVTVTEDDIPPRLKVRVRDSEDAPWQEADLLCVEGNREFSYHVLNKHGNKEDFRYCEMLKEGER